MERCTAVVEQLRSRIEEIKQAKKENATMEITVRINESRLATKNPLQTAITSRIAKLYSDATGRRLSSVSKQVRVEVRPGSAFVVVKNKPFRKVSLQQQCGP